MSDGFKGDLSAKVNELIAERARLTRAIDDKIASLSLAWETLYGELPDWGVASADGRVSPDSALLSPLPPVRKRRRGSRSKASIAEAAIVVSERGDKGKATRPRDVARKLGISNAAANSHLSRLVAAGNIRRISRGVYAEHVLSNGAAS
jgi:hypothetical protein